MNWFVEVLRHHPEVVFFLVLGIGYVLGKVAFGSFKLGAVTGTLLAGAELRPSVQETRQGRSRAVSHRPDFP
jgi:hypothetical protein